MPLGDWENRRLCLELEEHRIEWWEWDVFQVDRILVYLDGTVTQTILPPEMTPPVTEDSWDGPCEGFFSFDPDFKHGQPIVMDLNFDGYLDFGLMSSGTFARNLPYIFYLWDPVLARFDCLGELNYTIKADGNTRQLLETIYGGNEGDTLNWYAWEDGKLVLVRREQEDFLHSPVENVTIDGGFYQEVTTHIYVRENGRLVQKKDESHYYPAG